jgi:hypothetical protein
MCSLELVHTQDQDKKFGTLAKKASSHILNYCIHFNDTNI